MMGTWLSRLPLVALSPRSGYRKSQDYHYLSSVPFLRIDQAPGRGLVPRRSSSY